MKHLTQNPHMLKIVAIVCFLLAVATLFPWTFSQDKSMLGYYALCPFSPISTGLLLYSGLMISRYRRNKA